MLEIEEYLLEYKIDKIDEFSRKGFNAIFLFYMDKKI
jgi:hypothetical protein